MPSPLSIAKAKLSSKDRKDLPKSSYVFPDKAPGSGSYPIPDLEHARKALQLSGGKPENAKVKAAVYRKYPQLKENAQKADTIMVEKSSPIEVDTDQQIVYGVVMSPGVEDSQGDIVNEATIEKAAHEWMIEHRKQDVQHSEVAKDENGKPLAEPVESFIAPEGLELNGQPVLKGAWVLGTKVHDAGVWQDVLDGKISGYSIGGSGVRTPIVDA